MTEWDSPESVVEKGTYNGTVTDLDGNYTLMVSTPEATLTFTYIGYKTTDVALAGRTAVDHALAADIAGLEEAIVIGYGNQQRRTISGAVGTIDITDATAVPVLRTEQALQGRAAGVQVTQNPVNRVHDPFESGNGLPQQRRAPVGRRRHPDRGHRLPQPGRH